MFLHEGTFFMSALIVQVIACPSFTLVKSILHLSGVDRIILATVLEVFALQKSLK